MVIIYLSHAKFSLNVLQMVYLLCPEHKDKHVFRELRPQLHKVWFFY